MSETSGKRLAQGRVAPVLLVVYLCRECGEQKTLDAYDGPPSCEGGGGIDEKVRHRPVWMQAQRLVSRGDVRGGYAG